MEDNKNLETVDLERAAGSSDDAFHHGETMTGEASHPSSRGGRGSRRNIVVASVLLVAILFGVLFGILHDRNDNNNSNTQAQTSALVSQEKTNKGDGATTTTTEEKTSNGNGTTGNDKNKTQISNTSSNSSNKTSSDCTTNKTNTTDPFANLTKPPFEVKLAPFSSDLVKGYTGASDFGKDLEQAAMSQINSFIMQRRQWNQGGGMFGARPPTTAESTDASSGTTTSDASPTAGATTQTSGSGPTDSGTNNQITGIEEGDQVVSDGLRVYAAFDDKIIVWDAATGANVTRVKMDPIANQTNSTGGNGDARPEMYPGGGMWCYGCHARKPAVRHLAISNGYLIAIVDGYGVSLVQPSSIYYDPQNTRALIYQIQSDGTLVKKAFTTFDGSFNSLRIIGDNAHVFTTASLRTWDLLAGELSRPEYANLTEAELIAVAKNTVIPSFVQLFTASLKGNNGNWPNIFQLSNMQPDAAGNTGNAAYDLLYGNGLQNMAMVTSFSVSSSAANGVISSKATVLFVPFWLQGVFAFSKYAVFFGYGQKMNAANRTLIDATYIYSVRLNGATSQPDSVALMDGSVINNYAFGGKNNLLYVATTVRPAWQFVIFNDMMMGASDAVAMDSSSESGADIAPIPQPDWTQTENYLIVYQMPGRNGTNSGTMAEKGRVKLGKPRESIKSVRLYPDQNIGYVVTFETKDPLYLLDLSVPTLPTIMAAIEAPGYSDYLHPWDSSLRVMIGIGQTTDANGWSTGTKVAVYNFMNLSNPHWIERAIEADNTTYSWSDTSWDYHSIRFVKQENLLVIPVHLSNYEQNLTFDGFYLFRVLESSIEQLCTVEHDSSNFWSYNCWNCYLPSRSMLFNGNLMTINAHSVKSTAVSDGTCAARWEFNTLQVFGDPEDQTPYDPYPMVGGPAVDPMVSTSESSGWTRV